MSEIYAWNKAFSKTGHYTFKKVVVIFTMVDLFTVGICLRLVEVVKEVCWVAGMIF